MLAMLIVPWGLIYCCCFIRPALSMRDVDEIICPPDEIPVECIDRCQTCEYRNGRCSQDQVCTPGCNCLKGFFRNQQGKCVPEAFCDVPTPLRCPRDEEYRECACEKNCCNRNNPEACGKECLTGCFCREGLVRDSQGNCIRPENCPPSEPPKTCGPNEVYSDCVDACNDCQSRNVTCNFLVCNKGCDCRPGYTRNDQRICIPESLCPPAVTAARGECDLVTVGNGRYNCTYGPDGGTRCDIYCDGKYQGRYVCYPGKGWTPPLPRCVKPKPVTEVVTAARGECQLITVGNGYYNCTTGQDGGTRCDIFCDGKYQGRYVCYSGKGWTPSLPRCVKPKPVTEVVTTARGECQLITVGNGYYNCTTGPDGGTRCDIYCDGKYQGRFVCYPERGWTPPLPRCVKPKPLSWSTTDATMCPPNEIPVPCIDRCQTCQYRNGGCAQPQVCTPGCNCLQGFYRNKQGKCIPAAFCDDATTVSGECQLITVGNGYYNCTTGPDGSTRCDIYCDGKYQGRFVCYPGRGWTPPLPRCVKPKPTTAVATAASGECQLITVGNGYYNCNTGPDGGTRCDIYCDGKYEGRYVCYPGKGWTPPLPRCVKPKPATEVVTEATGECQLITVGNGYYNCTTSPDGVTRCDIYCDGKYQGRYVCYPGRGWTPPLPRCVKPKPATEVVTEARGECQLITVGNGYYNCTTSPDGVTRCDIYCDGKYQGRFVCYPGRGWTPPLPRCVKPKPLSLTAPDTIICPPNEIPGCIDACQTCEYRNGGCYQVQVCTPGCNCLQGFYRNKQGKCIPSEFCDEVCGPHSKPSDCVFCEPTCRNPKPQACAQSCTKGCACDPGFIKDDYGNCIPEYQCPGRGRK